MRFAEYSSYDGMGLAELVRKGEVTAAELVEACIDRIEKHNEKLNAVVYRMDEVARELAAGELPDGPFKGVPFLLKDLLGYYKGVPITSGSRAFRDQISPVDSELVARFKRGGLVTVGKTNTPEFGLISVTKPLLFGPARNPWDLSRTPGGSSGGSAAAVAAGIVPFAHGNDGGGSIRIPSACCGLVGLKPTRARNPMGPLYGDMMSGLVCEHVLTRSVRDTAAVLDITAGPDDGDPYWAPPPKGKFLDAVAREPGQLRIAFSTTELDGKPMHPDAVAAVERAASLCESIGHVVEEGMPKIDYRVFSLAWGGLWAGGAAGSVTSAERFFGITPSEDVFEPLTLAFAEAGDQVSAADYMSGVFLIQMVSREVAKFFRTHDVWMAPTLGRPPLDIGAVDVCSRDLDKLIPIMHDFHPCTAIANGTGQPAISLPLYWTAENLPMGVQFAGRFGDEETLLSLAAQLEQAAPWADKHPPIWG